MIVLLLLTAGCAATRVVHLDTGQGPPRVYKPIGSEPVRVGDDEFKASVAQLVLDLRLNVDPGLLPSDDRRSLLASSGGIVDGAHGSAVSSPAERMCQQSGVPGCVTLFMGGTALGTTERSLIALFFAFDTVWQGVEDVVEELTEPAALRAMVVSMVGTSLVMLVAPEPITKIVAIGLTASLIAYLGTGPARRWPWAPAPSRATPKDPSTTSAPTRMRYPRPRAARGRLSSRESSSELG